MDAVRFLGIRNRMCRSFGGCRKCPAYINAGGCFSSADPERLVRAVEGWVAAADTPTVDVAPAAHGWWIEDERTYPGAGLSNNLCSVCGGIGGAWKKGLEPERKWRFCPNCGAKMEGEGNAEG